MINEEIDSVRVGMRGRERGKGRESKRAREKNRKRENRRTGREKEMTRERERQRERKRERNRDREIISHQYGIFFKRVLLNDFQQLKDNADFLRKKNPTQFSLKLPPFYCVQCRVHTLADPDNKDVRLEATSVACQPCTLFFTLIWHVDF